MNIKFYRIKVIIFIAASLLAVTCLIPTVKANAYIGQTVNQMKSECSGYSQVSLSSVSQPQSPTLNYNALVKEGVTAYRLTCSGWNLTALFNNKGVCFRIYTSTPSQTLPDPSLLIGPLAGTQPTVLSDYETSLVLNKYMKYGSGKSAVIYAIIGLKSSPVAEAYSITLMH